MGKIKINLVSGASLEKPLVSCFKGTNANYIVLDNESNGSMGLPIIIISKLNGTNLEKIIDPNEWGAVKENLKTIIGGTALPYLSVPETLNAPDDFFTQLTLPVASFDLLKSVYAPPADEANGNPTAAPSAVETTPAVEPAPVEDVVATPTEIALAPIAENTSVGEIPVVNENPVTSVEAPAVEKAPVVEPTQAQVPVAETPMAPETSMTNDIKASVVTPEAAPITPSVPVSNPEVSVAPVAEPTPVQTPVVESPVAVTEPSAPAIDLPVSQPAGMASIDPEINLIKETFMKSCENMFDALMKKFGNK